MDWGKGSLCGYRTQYWRKLRNLVKGAAKTYRLATSNGAAVITAGGMKTSPEGNMVRKDTKEQVGPNELRVVTEKVSKQNNVIQRDDASMALLPNMGSTKGTFIG